MGIYTAVDAHDAGGNSFRWLVSEEWDFDANFAEDIRETLSVGKLADFVALSEDILTIPPEQTLRTKVLLKVMGGKDTYRSAEF